MHITSLFHTVATFRMCQSNKVFFMPVHFWIVRPPLEWSYQLIIHEFHSQNETALNQWAVTSWQPTNIAKYSKNSKISTLSLIDMLTNYAKIWKYFRAMPTYLSFT